MNRNRYLLIGGILVLGISIFVAVGRNYQNKEAKRVESIIHVNKEPLVRSYSPRMGAEAAAVTIVEFFDPECESCRAFYPAVKQLLKTYDGKVQLVLRYMPLHKNSSHAAAMLEATRRQGKYWEALDLLLEKQPEWASHHAPRPELIPGYLKTLGLDVDAVKTAAEESDIKNRILQDNADARELGVTGTPTFFVNSEKLQQLGYEQLKQAIEAALAKAQNQGD